MIKVIKHGEPTLSTTCPYCHAELEYNKHDIDITNIDEYVMGWHTYYSESIVCPDCHSTIKLKVCYT